MNITFLVGNGFDIANGIDTSYAAFYEWYCEQPSDNDLIANFKLEIEKDGENWSDFELGLGKYTKKFNVKNVEDFFKCYEDSHEKIIEFLEKQKANFSVSDITEDELSICNKGLLNFYQELYPREQKIFSQMIQSDRQNNTTINFLSFNYTDILNQIVARISKNPLYTWEYYNSRRVFKVNSKVLQLHGTSNQFPILGVNDSSQIANQDLLTVENFKEVVIKSEAVNAVGQFWYEDAKSTINSSQIICIFGMSFGFTDAKWWVEILKWLKANGNRQIIIYWYIKEFSNTTSVYKDLTMKNKVKELLFRHVDFSLDEIEQLSSRVHVVINTEKVLQIPHAMG